jgi:hypothetical protein
MKAVAFCNERQILTEQKGVCAVAEEWEKLSCHPCGLTKFIRTCQKTAVLLSIAPEA